MPPEPVRLRAAAVLFDLDGVLVDSQPILDEILADWATAAALDPAEVAQSMHGRPTAEALADLVPPGEIDAHRAHLDGEEIRRSTEMRCLPGVPDVLTALNPWQWAVVTSGAREVAKARLEAVGCPSPGVLITADDVRQGKPDPECYRLAATRLAVPAGNCVAFDDASAGVAAASGAGVECVGVGLAGRPAGMSVGSLADVRVRPDGPMLVLEF